MTILEVLAKLPDDTFVLLNKEGETTLHGRARNILRMEDINLGYEVVSLTPSGLGVLDILYKINN